MDRASCALRFFLDPEKCPKSFGNHRERKDTQRECYEYAIFEYLCVLCGFKIFLGYTPKSANCMALSGVCPHKIYNAIVVRIHMTKYKFLVIVSILVMMQIASCTIGHVALKERRIRAASRMAERRRLMCEEGSHDTPTRWTTPSPRRTTLKGGSSPSAMPPTPLIIPTMRTATRPQ